jgi:hypothetical protein
MRLLAKVMLLLSLLSVGLSFTKAGGDFLGGGLKPLGAILFIVFFILELMQNEVKQYDQERRENLRRAAKYGALTSAATKRSTAEPVSNEKPEQDNRRAERLRERHGFGQHAPRGDGRHHRLQQEVQ